MLTFQIPNRAEYKYRNIQIDLILVFNATFSNISAIHHGDQFYWWKKPEYPKRTTDYEQLTGKNIQIKPVFKMNKNMDKNIENQTKLSEIITIHPVIQLAHVTFVIDD